MAAETTEGTVSKAFASALENKPIRRHKGERAVEVCDSEDLPEGGVRILDVDGFSIGVFRIGEGLRAIRNECPHNGAELCRGHVSSAYPPGPPASFVPEPALEGRVITCPWHGRQFDIVTGQALFEHGGSVLTYDVWEDDGKVLVRI